jgi:hypothetical protein
VRVLSLKAAIDWLSRSPADIARVFGGKPLALAGASPGAFATILRPERLAAGVPGPAKGKFQPEWRCRGIASSRNQPARSADACSMMIVWQALELASCLGVIDGLTRTPAGYSQN